MKRHKYNKGDNIHRSSAKNTLESLKIQNPIPIPDIFTPLTIINSFRINPSWKTRKERLNRSTKNRDVVDKAKHDVVSTKRLNFI